MDDQTMDNQLSDDKTTDAQKMDNQKQNNKEQALIELFVDGLSKMPHVNQHLLIASFLTVKMENVCSMMAFVTPVKSRFKELVEIKIGKYKKGLFESTLEELSYTFGGQKAYNEMESFREDIRVKITGYTYRTIFLLSNELEEINSLHVYEIDNKHTISVVEPFYSILKRYEKNFDFDDCKRVCIRYRNDNEDKKRTNMQTE